MEQSLGGIAWNVEGDPQRLATVTENAVPHSLQRVPKSAGIRVGTGSVGGNPEGHQFKHLPIWLTWWNSEGQAESGGASHLTPPSLAILPGNPLTDSVKEGPETVEFSPRLTPREGIQPKIVIHPLKPLEFTPRTGIQPNRIHSPLTKTN
ncbi:hypothetical protein R3P38DRAFT_2770880 [Favolaschia claudopus]|uniref:Uncharacterized protein n=1 Tax=Favolaschia claudopus TaxID=2862362 RepID=A0AAW0CIC8_9AGAR